MKFPKLNIEFNESEIKNRNELTTLEAVQNLNLINNVADKAADKWTA